MDQTEGSGYLSRGSMCQFVQTTFQKSTTCSKMESLLLKCVFEHPTSVRQHNGSSTRAAFKLA